MTIATVALLRHGGSHLIRPIVAGLGCEEIVEPGKNAPLDRAQGPVIAFVRDPRDRMAATLRWWRGKPGKAARLPAGDDEALAWLLVQAEDGGFLAAMLEWARIWCFWPGALRVSFEDMRAQGPAEVGRIAAHLGLPADPARDGRLFGEHYAAGKTYTGRHSDWRQTFGPLANAAWAAHGGAELLEIMGYDA